MAITKLASAAAANAANFATINTTGASLLFLAQSANGAAGPTPTDSQSNTWTAGPTLVDVGGRDEISTFYVLAPSTSATHSFSSTALFGSGYIGAFSGTLTAAATDGTSSHSNSVNSNSETTGSITTTGSGDIVFAIMSLDDNALTGSPTISTGSVDGFVNNNPGSLFGIMAAFIIQTSAGTYAPTVTRTNAAGAGKADNAVMIAFKAAASTAPPGSQSTNRTPDLPSQLDETWTQSLRPPNQIPSHPFNQYDWPNPYPVQWDRHHFNRLRPPQPIGGPFNQFDWPNPVQPFRMEETWTKSKFPPNLPGTPFNQTDWPNPTLPFRMEETWIQSLRPPQPIGGPFNQYDWPVPTSAFRIEQTWINPAIQAVFNPFSQHDWPNPAPLTWYQSWTAYAMPPQPTGGPFNQYDWQNPRTPQPIEQTWLWNLQEFVIIPPFPHNQYDWSNPRGYAPIDQFWSQSFRLTNPFAQYDWPTPRGFTPADQFWSQTFQQTPVTAPFVQRDWPLTSDYIRLVQTWINNLPPGIIGQVIQPFAQYDWSNPKTSQPIDQSWYINTSLLPIPLPPPLAPSTGGRQVEEWEVDQWALAANEYYKRVIDAYNTKTAQDISKIAAELGSRGGNARAKALTSTQRTNIATKAAQTRWR